MYEVGFGDKTVLGAGGDVGWAGGGCGCELGAGFGVVDGAGGAAVADEVWGVDAGGCGGGC